MNNRLIIRFSQLGLCLELKNMAVFSMNLNWETILDKELFWSQVQNLLLTILFEYFFIFCLFETLKIQMHSSLLMFYMDLFKMNLFNFEKSHTYIMSTYCQK